MTLIGLFNFISNRPLNNDRKFESIFRFFKWKFGIHLVLGEVVFEWISGSKISVKSGVSKLASNIYMSIHEFPDMKFLLNELRNKELFINVVLRIGSCTILVCSIIGDIGIAYWELATAVLSVGLSWLFVEILQFNSILLAMLLSEIFIASTCAWLAYVAMADSLLRKPIT